MKAALALFAGITASASAWAADVPPARASIEEWQIPWRNSRPRSPVLGPAGHVWFAAQRGDYVAALDPATGEFRRIELASGTAPHDIAVHSDGTVYFTGKARGRIGRIDPTGADVRDIPLSKDDAREPGSLVLDQAGNLYFTVQDASYLGRYDAGTERVELIGVPTERSRPNGIVIAPSGTVWAAELGANKLAKLDRSTLSLSEIVLPRERSRPRRLATTSDGRIWYVDYAEGMLGFMHPETGLFKEYPLPGGNASRPYAMTADRYDVLWLVESGASPDRLVAFDPASESFDAPQDIPGNGGTGLRLCYDAHAHALWFVTGGNSIARATLPAPR